MAKQNHITDLTVGNPLGHILRFMLPLLIGNLFQQLYNLVDSVVVGNYVGAAALAAVGTCGSLSFLFFSLSSGLAIGIGILASQYFGARDPARIRATIANSIWVLTAAGLAVSATGVIAAPALLRLLRTPASVFDSAVVYLRVTSAGILFVALYNGVASLLRALGDSRSPLYFLIFSCLLNIVLDLTFVLYLKLEVFGVALATVLAQFCSFAVSAVYAWRKVAYFRLTRTELRPDPRIIRQCLRLGVPMALQSSLIAVSVTILQAVINGFGETVVAANTVVGRVEQLAHMPFVSLSTALTSFSGQNIGAGKTERVIQSFRLSVWIVAACSLVMLPISFLWGDDIVRGFVKDDAVITIGYQALRISSLFYFGLGMIYAPRGILNGSGDSGFALVNGFTEVICRIVFALVLTRIPAIGFWGIWYTSGLTWVVTAVVCTVRCLRGPWRRKSMAIPVSD